MGPTEFQSLMTFCLYLMIRISHWNSKFTAKPGIAQKRGVGVDVLTAFNKTWMQNYIIHIAQVLKVLDEFGEVNLYSLSSFPCEHIFAYLRTHCHFHNDIDAARVALKGQIISQFIDWTIGTRHEGNRVPEHQTTTVKSQGRLAPAEIKWIWELSGHALDLIYKSSSTKHNGM